MDQHQQKPAVVRRFESDGYRIFSDELEYILQRRCLAGYADSDSRSRGKETNRPSDNEGAPETGPADRAEEGNLFPRTELNLVGLALSGGGIRSATFNLGLLQALFKTRMLQHVDYLSTVSGGGYIGSCLTTILNSNIREITALKDRYTNMWSPEHFPFARFKKSKPEERMDESEPFKAATGTLKDRPMAGVEKTPVNYLRYFSNYLTAEGSFIRKYFGPLLVLLRGILFNFLLIAPHLILAALILSYVYSISSIYQFGDHRNNRWFFDIHEFKNALTGREQAEKSLEAFVVLETAGLKLKDYDEQLKYAESSNNLKYTFDKHSKAIENWNAALEQEWKDIWRIPKYLFMGMFLISFFSLAFFTRSSRRRFLYSKYFSIGLFLLLSAIGIQLYGVVLVYWGVWKIPPQYGMFSIISFLAPLLLKYQSRKEKNTVLQIFISICVVLLAPLFLLYLVGIIIKYVIPQYAIPLVRACWEAHPPLSDTACYLVLLAAIILLWHVVEKMININKISLHNFYRDRLSRAYLFQNDPDKSGRPFDKIKPCDDLKLSKLEPLGPYHIVNANLNLSQCLPGEESEGNLRTGESFIFSKCWCGSDKTGYRKTDDYETLDAHQNLGTAMAISGAAVNVGMAQSNQPLFRFLMGLLNIRLGYWATNPGSYRKKFKSILYGDYPGSLTSIREWFGNYSLTYRFVNLSDGGHFDNSGIYELLRRRCKYIVFGDAEADPDMRFEALAYIIRLARIDFGIDIVIDISDMLPGDDGRYALNHCVVGEINYPEGSQGYLLYCKSSITGDEPHHLLEYKKKHPGFPHQTTADQWFDEQQFEAYRSLGYHVGWEVFKPIEKIEGAPTMEENFLKLKQYWHPQSSAVRRHLSKHGNDLNQILTHIKTDTDLAFMDYQIYPEWNDLLKGTRSKPARKLWLPDDAVQIRKGFYVCNLMIQLMENVYTDLDLEKQYDHPDIRGWMNLFMHWSWAGMFRVTWAISSCTSGSRFQSFCERQLKLTPGTVSVDPLANDQDSEQIRKILNAYEYMIFEILNRTRQFSYTDVFSFKLNVPDVLDENNCKQFGFGFALLRRDTIVFFRVQDHLRAMGLGRKALMKLVDKFDGNVTYDFSDVPKEQMEFEEFHEEDFAIMFQSVLTELEKSRYSI